MARPVIPVEAVEAAAKAFYGTALDDVPPEDMEYALEGARLALEAAAPYMLKQGWDEGYRAGLFDKEYYSHNRNPYILNNEGEK